MEDANRPVRKRNRLKGYDYSQDGAYFLTICLKNRQPLLGDMSTVGAANGRPYRTYHHQSI